ncbi:SprT family zinc-dependent metalloprotease [Shewanella psychropiezotolerans]|uniref:Protein SprT n=1 Tax=Shewanella psychropiezotolerans TaxID=2593655 RepID=A0ABX5WU47_9GAMM|nr:SprT family zinc-dependent metalloprotease [Shewanella psychropiezotolerans]QDO82534.1 SprT family zinc-dependent metalloprotease [Shewanella psychropiezotolerans]
MFNLFGSKNTAQAGSFETAHYEFEDERHQQIAEQVLDYYRQAETHLKRTFPHPEISFKLRGKSAGTAHLQLNLLRFNSTLLAENHQAFIDQVVPHEICHLLAYQLYGKVKPHGKEWQALMIKVYQLEPATTHTLNTESVSGKTFDYLCDCGNIPLSIRRHNKVIRGETQYRCRCCKQELKRA